jgi:hypothetical protein
VRMEKSFTEYTLADTVSDHGNGKRCASLIASVPELMRYDF